MKSVSVTLVLLSLILSSFFLQYATADSSTTYAPKGVCDSKCGVRCLNAGVKDRCLKYCGLCCQQCKCVPSGTYGNKSECPCYRDKLNSKGKSKCP
ncbi:peamaclein-like isoform X1 [Cucumis sativus]|uniref:Snakin-1 n=1 Tax=Cucumis sativus TaxID=3659 RepID=A0A0A0KLG3_CUCSA|nr:peamaclein-like isoform X1 [Cucumis sativus]